MGFYIGIAKKTKKGFENVYQIDGWVDNKYYLNREAFYLMAEQDFKWHEIFPNCFEYVYRPINFKEIKEKLKKLEYNKEVFISLLKKLEKNKDYYIFADD